MGTLQICLLLEVVEGVQEGLELLLLAKEKKMLRLEILLLRVAIRIHWKIEKKRS